MNDPKKEAQKTRLPKWLIPLAAGFFAGVILTLAVVGIVYAASRRPYIPPDLPTDVEVLPNDPEKTPIFENATPLPALDHSATKTAALGAEVAVLLDVSTGKVLASKEGQKRFDPASITKIMTLIVACERLSEEDLDEKVTITEEIWTYAQTGGYKDTDAFGFDPGDETTIRALLFGIGVSSFSDCTVPLVRKLAASEEEFVGWMNQKAQELGLTSTHFDNAVGYESENNYSTVEDLAVLTAYALKCDRIREILSSSSYVFYFSGYTKSGEWKEGIRGTFYSTLFNANGKGRIADYEKDTGKKFSLAKGTFDGGKTGSLKFDSKWKYSLASFATIDGKTYVSVVGNSSSSAGLMKDVKSLFDGYVD